MDFCEQHGKSSIRSRTRCRQRLDVAHAPDERAPRLSRRHDVNPPSVNPSTRSGNLNPPFSRRVPVFYPGGGPVSGRANVSELN